MATTLHQIKTHKEEYTDLEIRLRWEIEAVLPENERHYRTEENLESLKNYRKENRRTEENQNGSFIPSNHYYAFLDDELVGFIHTWPQNDKISDISIPFAKDEEVAELLYNHLKEDLKKRGFEELALATGYLNSMALAWGEKNGFSKADLSTLTVSINPSEINFNAPGKYTIRDYTPDDQAKVTDLYVSQGYPRERIDQQFNYMNENVLNSPLKVSWLVAERDDKIIGHTLCSFNGENTKDAYMNAVTNNVADEEKPLLFADMYAKQMENARSKEVTSILLTILPQVLNLRKFYEEIGLEFTENYTYKRSL